MTKWLPTNEKNSLPSFATAYLGAGGAVIDEENSEILLLTDRYNPTQDGKDLWVILCWLLICKQIPGGAVEVGEDIADAAIREVFEETGVKTEFVTMLSFRHLHNYRFGM